MIYDMPSCGGCRTCEIACSFHHTGKFNSAISSIKIVENEDESGYRVMLLEESGIEGIACDGCDQINEPLCMQYCREKEQLNEIIKSFMELRRSGKQEAIML